MPATIRQQDRSYQKILEATLERDGHTCWSCGGDLHPGSIALRDIPLEERDPVVPHLVSRTRALCSYCD